jgi:hypothetical protein
MTRKRGSWWLPPGGRVTLFTLPMHDILRLGDTTQEGGAWRWGWLGPPRKPPPHSPVHVFRGSGWQAHVAESVRLWTRVTVDGNRIQSQPMIYTLKQQPRISVGPIKTHDPARTFTITTADGRALLRQEDLVAYHWPSHSLRFQPGALRRAMAQFAGKLPHLVEFQMRMGRDILYSGQLIMPDMFDSRRVTGEVTLRLDRDENTTLEWNTDGASSNAPVDPRAHPKLKNALIDAQLLLQ